MAKIRRAARGGVLLPGGALFSAALLLSGASPAAAAPRENLERGKVLYTERCVFCHGKDGGGWDMRAKAARPPVPVPDLTRPAFMRGFTDKELFRVVKEGGTREGKSRFMPPSGLWLSDEDIRDVIFYVRSLERRPPGARKER